MLLPPVPFLFTHVSAVFLTEGTASIPIPVGLLDREGTGPPMALTRDALTRWSQFQVSPSREQQTLIIWYLFINRNILPLRVYFILTDDQTIAYFSLLSKHMRI
jgi:hypothetical protein